MSWALVFLAVPAVVAGCGAGGPGASAELSPGLGRPAIAAPVRSLDQARLPAALSAAGVLLPPGANVYAVVLDRDKPRGRYEQFEAGGGALAEDFWPASSVKLLAAVGALAYVRTLGLTGAATVSYGGGAGAGPSVRAIARSAIEESSNEAYDQLLEIAGVDWLNTAFLTAESGFPETVVQRSYAYSGVVSSPELTFSEGAFEVTVPARVTEGGFGVPAAGNRSNLRELTESVRRVVLHGVLAPEERFDIDAVDALVLELALLGAEGFIEPAATQTFAGGVLVYDKPGYVVGDDCVDVAYIDSVERSQAYLLAVSTPDDGRSCETVTDVARGTLGFLETL